MIEINDAKIAVVHELGLITSISKFHKPDGSGQVMYNIVIVSNAGIAMFPITKDLFEQWILGINQAMTELEGKKIIQPHLQLTRGN